MSVKQTSLYLALRAILGAASGVVMPWRTAARSASAGVRSCGGVAAATTARPTPSTEEPTPSAVRAATTPASERARQYAALAKAPTHAASSSGSPAQRASCHTPKAGAASSRAALKPELAAPTAAASPCSEGTLLAASAMLRRPRRTRTQERTAPGARRREAREGVPSHVIARKRGKPAGMR